MSAPPAPAPEAAFEARQRRLTSGWRRFVFPGIWLVYLGQTASGVSRHSTGAAAVAGYALIVLFCGLYLLVLPQAWQAKGRGFWVGYVAMFVMCGAECAFAHEDALVMTVYIAVVTASGMRRPAAPIIAALTVVATFLPPLVPAWHAGIDGAMALTLPLVGLAMWGFTGIIRSNIELAAARSEVARLAAENERSRIARDLHDLLGHSLTTITVKAGLARRLAERGEPIRAAAEIAEVEALSRGTLADVRATVAGYREVTLAGELASGREVLRAAGIAADFPGAIDVVDPSVRDLFGWVVREGVTNVVRHSRCARCTVRLGRDWVEIEDDGHGGISQCGNGLSGLRERVAAVGGQVLIGPARDGGGRGWSLRAEVPLGGPAPASAPVATSAARRTPPITA